MPHPDKTNRYLESLRHSAPLAREWSELHCRSGVYGGSSCQWYHGVWQYFSLLGVVSTPWREKDFYLHALSALPESRPIDDVLISGASDYAMLALAAEGIFRAGRPAPRFMVCDACYTPLILNRWYAQRENIDCITSRGDILEIGSPGCFDLICTHAFFGNFPPLLRPNLVKRWCELLRPGGYLFTINRIRPGVTGLLRFSNEQAVDFRRRVIAAAGNAARVLDVDVDTLASMASRYTSTYVTHPVSDVDEVEHLFYDNGFVLERFEWDDSCTRTDGPSSSIAGIRVRIVARREH